MPDEFASKLAQCDASDKLGGTPLPSDYFICALHALLARLPSPHLSARQDNRVSLRLPPDFMDVLKAGASALRDLEVILEREIADRPEAPELLLRLRDASGIVGRLEMQSDEMTQDQWWVSGYALLLFSPQDLSVLSDLADVLQNDSPYLSETGDVANRVRAIAALRVFLQSYLKGDFGLPDNPLAPGQMQ